MGGEDPVIDFKELAYFIKHVHEYAEKIETLLKQWKLEDEEEKDDG